MHTIVFYPFLLRYIKTKNIKYCIVENCLLFPYTHYLRVQNIVATAFSLTGSSAATVWQPQRDFNMHLLQQYLHQALLLNLLNCLTTCHNFLLLPQLPLVSFMSCPKHIVSAQQNIQKRCHFPCFWLFMLPAYSQFMLTPSIS